MRKMIVIAAREYNAAVRTKAFLISLLMMPIMMGGSIAVQTLLRDRPTDEVKSFAVIDFTPGQQLGKSIQQAVAARQQGQQKWEVRLAAPEDGSPAALERLREKLADEARAGGLLGFAEIGPDVFTMPAVVAERAAVVVDVWSLAAQARLRPPLAAGPAPYLLGTAAATLRATLPPAHTGKAGNSSNDVDAGRGIRYRTNRPLEMGFSHLVQEVVTEQAQRRRGALWHLWPVDVDGLVREVPLDSTGLPQRAAGPQGPQAKPRGQEQVQAFLAPFSLLFLMFMVVLMTSTPLMQGVVEEKMQRIAEVLLGSVRPFELMLGKLLGMTAVSLTMSTVYLAGGYWAARHFGLADAFSAELLVWFLVFQVLAALMYGSLFTAVGAACTDMKETQTLMWPVMLLVMIPMFLIGSVIQEPNGPLVKGVSLFPFAAPMLMVARMAVPPGNLGWQPYAAVAGVLVTTLLCVWAAGRIFRAGILMQGKAASVGEIARWVLRG
jgi:ABC-2 type transport system permease protein